MKRLFGEVLVDMSSRGLFKLPNMSRKSGIRSLRAVEYLIEFERIFGKFCCSFNMLLKMSWNSLPFCFHAFLFVNHTDLLSIKLKYNFTGCFIKDCLAFFCS